MNIFRGIYVHLIWFDLFHLQSPQLVQHSCSARMIWDSNKVIIIIIIIIITHVQNFGDNDDRAKLRVG